MAYRMLTTTHWHRAIAVALVVLSESLFGCGDRDDRATTDMGAADSTSAITSNMASALRVDSTLPSQDALECREIADALTPFTQTNIERATAQYSNDGSTEGLAATLSKCHDSNGLSTEAASYVLPQGVQVQIRIDFEYGPESTLVKGPIGASAIIVGSNIVLASAELIGMGGGGRSEPVTIRFAETQFAASGFPVYKGVLKFDWITGERFGSDRMLGHKLIDVFTEWPR